MSRSKVRGTIGTFCGADASYARVSALHSMVRMKQLDLYISFLLWLDVGNNISLASSSACILLEHRECGAVPAQHAGKATSIVCDAGIYLCLIEGAILWPAHLPRTLSLLVDHNLDILN